MCVAGRAIQTLPIRVVLYVRRLARSSQDRCAHRGWNQRKLFCDNEFARDGGFPRWRQSVGRIRPTSEPLKAALLWAHWRIRRWCDQLGCRRASIGCGRQSDPVDLALCRLFTDRREAECIEHTTTTLVGQRVVGIALGYEDLSSFIGGFLFGWLDRFVHDQPTRTVRPPTPQKISRKILYVILG